MNRLQKKCVIATAGFHLLLLLILIVGPAFFNARPKTENLPVLDVIPANLVDVVVNSGTQAIQPPAPAPVATPPPQPVQPTPAVIPPPSLLTKLEKIFTPETPKPSPAPKEIQPHTPKVNLHLIVRDPPKNSTPAKPNTDPTLNSVIKKLQAKLSPATTIEMPGGSSASYANYGDVVVSVYYHAWVPPDDMAGDSAVVKFTVTIARDGAVIRSSIIEKSGDPNVDAAVQRLLDSVSIIAPFPEDTTDKERTYTINFNATRTTQ